MRLSSGVEAESVDQEFVCAEWCEDCVDEYKTCDNIFVQNINIGPDDTSGDTVYCEMCDHKWTRY